MKIITITLLFIFFSCKSERNISTIEKEEELNSYFSKELHSEIYKDGIIVILQNQRCSSCRLATFQRLTDLIHSNKLTKIFIMARPDSAMEVAISSIPKSTIKIDASHRLKDYGLDFASDLFFLYRDSNLQKWFEISNENLDSLKSIE
jgi:hypothetical protein